MAVNISTAKNIATKISSKGVSLLRKETGLKIQSALKDGLKVPEGAKTYDAVRVGRNFKPAEIYTDIFTFRDANGKIVSRYVKKVDGKNISETKKWYEELCPAYRDSLGCDEAFDISARKIRSFTRENGRISQITEDVFSVADDTSPIITHSRKTITPGNEQFTRAANNETYMIRELRKGQTPKFIENKYLVDRDYNGSVELIESKASTAELTEIAKNSYFLPYVSPKSKFVPRIADACISDAKFVFPPNLNVYKKASTRKGFFSSSGDVNINLQSSRDLANSRLSLTTTVGHEVGHAKWDEKCILYDFYKFGIDRDTFLKCCSKAEIPDIERYKHSIEHYIPSKLNYKAYKEQFAEKVAFDEGKKAANKYLDLESSINKAFPNAHPFQFNAPVHNEDVRGEIMSLLDALI